MTNPTNSQDLCNQIEHLVQAYIAATRAAAQAAMERGFAMLPAMKLKAQRAPEVRRQANDEARRGVRRASAEVEALCERLYEVVCKMPGETMTVLAPEVGATSRELNRPMTRLKSAGRVRSVGTKHATRYFPMASEAPPRASA
jgi:prophage DNA circulation protein